MEKTIKDPYKNDPYQNDPYNETETKRPVSGMSVPFRKPKPTPGKVWTGPVFYNDPLSPFLEWPIGNV